MPSEVEQIAWCSTTYLSKIILFGAVAGKCPNFTEEKALQLKKSLDNTHQGNGTIKGRLNRYASRLLYQPARRT